MFSSFIKVAVILLQKQPQCARSIKWSFLLWNNVLPPDFLPRCKPGKHRGCNASKKGTPISTKKKWPLTSYSLYVSASTLLLDRLQIFDTLQTYHIQHYFALLFKLILGVSNTDLRLTVEVRSIEGTLVLNIPPPPTDRIWLGFRPLPDITLTARPIVGERHLSYIMVTSWIEKKLLLEFQVRSLSVLKYQGYQFLFLLLLRYYY